LFTVKLSQLPAKEFHKINFVERNLKQTKNQYGAKNGSQLAKLI
jgi:hypothetical protein